MRIRTSKIRNENSEAGDLHFIEGQSDIPFDIQRIYYLSSVPSGQNRGGHAHKKLEQFFVCLAGSFRIRFRDGIVDKTFQFTANSEGVYVPQMIWRDLFDFSEGAVCLVLASQKYDADDYIHDFSNFLEIKEKNYD